MTRGHDEEIEEAVQKERERNAAAVEQLANFYENESDRADITPDVSSDYKIMAGLGRRIAAIIRFASGDKS
jgi:hypothetical protein